MNNILNEGGYSKDIILKSRDDIQNIIKKLCNGSNKKFLDIGGAGNPRPELSGDCEYNIMDIKKIKTPYNLIIGDICSCPEIINDTYDIVFCMNLFEHVAEPWNAAKEMVRITKPGGIIICIAPFSWRYHPCPIDYYRFSHTALKFLFERTNLIKETILNCYDIKLRRKDHRGAKIKLYDNLDINNDVPPIDNLGGWRENWQSVWIGKKTY